MKKTIALLLLLGGLTLAHAKPKIDPLIDAEDRRQMTSPAIQAAAKDAKSAKRARAAIAYGRMLAASAIEPLFALLGDKNADVREAAVFGIGFWANSVTPSKNLPRYYDALTAFRKNTDLVSDWEAVARPLTFEAKNQLLAWLSELKSVESRSGSMGKICAAV